MDDLKSIIAKVATGATLSREEAASAFDSVMSGEATPSQMGGLLMGLRIRGETVDEITGAVSTMRAKMTRVAAPPDAIDVVGTAPGGGAGGGKGGGVKNHPRRCRRAGGKARAVARRRCRQQCGGADRSA